MLIFLIVIFVPSWAVPIEEERILIDIQNHTYILYNITLSYSDSDSLPSVLSYAFLGDIDKIIDAKLDGVTISCEVRTLNIGNEILCRRPRMDNINNNHSLLVMTVASSTGVYERKNISEFVFSKPIVDLTDKLNVRVILPPTAFIAESEIGSSVNPTNFKLSVDSTGRRIIVEWNIEKPPLGEKVDFSILFEVAEKNENKIHEQYENNKVIVYIFLSFLTALIASVIIWMKIYRKGAEKRIISVLKDDERFVLEIIKELGDGCKHKDIVKKTNFSKAKVSRILIDLEKRGLIRLERVGKNTKIYLV